MYKESHNIENLETEMSILKEKYEMANTTMQLGTNSCTTNENLNFNKKVSGPNVIKYPSIERLNKDNGKIATDSDGNVIMIGDYALVDINNGKELYIRQLITNSDMWIKEDMGVLYKLIQDKKSKCLANPEIKLDDVANKCTFDITSLKCEISQEFDAIKQKLDMELHLNNLQKEIDYIRNIPVLIAKLNKEIISERLILINRVNSIKRYWKSKEEEELRLEENNSKLKYVNKPCIHYDVTKYFFNIKNDIERYEFARIVLKQFINNDDMYKNDFTLFNTESREKNYTYCNICNKELLCNNFRLGVSYLENDTPINYDTIVTLFSAERNGSYYCKVDGCNELIDTTEIQDVDDFAKGEDAGRNKTREITENTPYIDKQKEYLTTLINNLYEGNNTSTKDELIQRVTIFKIIKKLSNIDILSIKDEIEMINFMKSYQFETKARILEVLASKIGKTDVAMLKKLLDKYYIRYLISDIGARFLITLQTSSTLYKITNNECNVNIIGYPIISDINAKDGINYIMCIFTQIAVLPEYANLADLQSQFFIDRLKKQVEEDNLVKDKIYNSINNKMNDIDSINSFYLYKTNFWKQFTPRLENSIINWSPEKILNKANLKEVTSKTILKMIDVGKENSIYYTLCLMQDINKIISLSGDLSATKELTNYCCSEPYNSKNPYKYLSYFKTKNSDITKNMNDFNEVNDIIKKLNNKKIHPNLSIIYDTINKKSQTVIKLNFNIIPNEIKEIYLKYIDSGLNKGKLHIYDRFNRCVLTNENKNDIAAKTYSFHDYKRIEGIINTNNQVIHKDKTDILLSIEDVELSKLNELIDKCPNLDILNYIKDYLIKISGSIKQIFDYKNDHHDHHDRHEPHKKIEKFDIYKHISILDSQIQIEIKDLIIKITSTDKNISKYSKILTNLGYFSKQCDEYNDTHNISNESDENVIDNGNLYRYNKKEEHIQHTIKLLNDILSQLKNGELSNPLNKEHIRPQYRSFLQFGENIKLFKTLSTNARIIYNFSRLFKSKFKYKIFFPEMVSSILQYLNVISLVNLFNDLETTKEKQTKTNANGNKGGEIIDYEFRKYEEPDESLKDLNKEMNLGIEYEDEDEPLIESIDIKFNNSNLKIISGFILNYLDKINDIQTTYDELTKSKIDSLVTIHDQKLRTANLKSFEWLSKSGNEAERQYVFLQMHKLKKLTYADLSQYLTKKYGDDFKDMPLTGDYNNDDVEYEEIDEYDIKAEYDEDGNEKEKQDIDIDNDEMGEVFDDEENEEGDQDYDYLAVDDGDND